MTSGGLWPSILDFWFGEAGTQLANDRLGGRARRPMTFLSFWSTLAKRPRWDTTDRRFSAILRLAVSYSKETPGEGSSSTWHRLSFTKTPSGFRNVAILPVCRVVKRPPCDPKLLFTNSRVLILRQTVRSRHTCVSRMDKKRARLHCPVVSKRLRVPSFPAVDRIL